MARVRPYRWIQRNGHTSRKGCRNALSQWEKPTSHGCIEQRNRVAT